MGRRAGLSTLLVFGAIVLALAILVGNTMGNRVLGQISSRASDNVTPIPIPSPSAADPTTNRSLLKRRQVLSVATDPAFPDPRITPEPEIPATPRPRPPSRKPSPSPSPSESGTGGPAPEVTPNTRYTSPAMLIPMASHAPDESVSPDASPTAVPRPTLSPHSPGNPRGVTVQRSAPSLPPVTVPSLSP